MQGRVEGPVLHDLLLPWYREARRDLPWRREQGDPYAVWLSEVMLQQTRVETVVPYYTRFRRLYPDVTALADTPLEEVLTQWSGLGYYRRARLLHRTATAVRDQHGGRFPATAVALRELPGVGPYTAGAVASIAFGERAALVDGNVVRVLARLFAVEEDVRGGSGLAGLWRRAEALVPAEAPGDWNQGLMELGATVCVPREPRCLLCPLQGVCEGKARGIAHKLPVLAPKAKPKVEVRLAVVATAGAKVLVVRRKDEGTFAGMWEPPSMEAPAADGLDAEAHLRRFLGTLGVGPRQILEVASAGRVVHVLSHRRLEVDVQRAYLRAPRGLGPRRLPREGIYDRAELLDADELRAVPLTTFARRVLAAGGFC